MTNFLATCGLFAGQGPPTVWAYIHRTLHHPYSDKEQDPHSTSKGLFHAYLGWQIDYHDEIKAKGIVDLLRNNYLKTLSHRYYLIFWGSLFVVFLISWPFFMFALVPSIVIASHVENIVNCLCHTPSIGYRNFDLKDRSTNIGWMGWLVWGQGYHNNHHAKPKAYSFALKKGEFDICEYIVPLLRKKTS